ncbi:60S ribosomal protein L1 [Cordyceps militaris CM01]|uniref:60S ribosomal protein L1 n=1 Tax=Cordyceps militaris (strain CM01) TaxID=983644 RepID=G3JPB2_CORMM|nr:60S ribosomal protein L1 [Cordyceps militaris CM01]EGX89722.1 60S ribosomal protein L1 [Cordyceps militaris CM01]
MPAVDKCLASLARLSLLQASRPTTSMVSRCLAPATLVQTRQASVVRIKKGPVKKKSVPKEYRRHNLDKTDFPRFSLVEAMRILRAYEVGQPPASVKYDLAINLKTARNGPVIKSSLRLPHPVGTDWRIAVICKEGSDVAAAASAAGAVAVGEASLFEQILNDNITFDRLLCHEGSEKALQKAGLGRVLGPKGLMPSARMKTIVTDVAKSIRDTAGSADYRERMGVVRLAVGQLGHTAEQLKANISAVLAKIKAECTEISEESHKEIHDVILSTTNGPAVSLSGKMVSEDDAVTAEQLSSAM